MSYLGWPPPPAGTWPPPPGWTWPPPQLDLTPPGWTWPPPWTDRLMDRHVSKHYLPSYYVRRAVKRLLPKTICIKLQFSGIWRGFQWRAPCLSCNINVINRLRCINSLVVSITNMGAFSCIYHFYLFRFHQH